MHAERARRLVKCGLVVWLVVALGLQWNRGLADNGDFSRIMTWFVAKPAGFAVNWPDAGTEAWGRRFFTYYIPRWQLDLPVQSLHPPGTIPVYSGVLLLWLPGLGINALLYSRTTLFLPLLSLLPRILLVVCLLLLLSWIDRRRRSPGERLLAYLTLALPFALFAAAADYVAYLNSFYQETGSLIYLLLFLGALVRLRDGPARPVAGAIALLLLILLTISKAGDFYWAFIGVPALLAPFLLKRPSRSSWLVYVVACLAVAGAITFASLSVTSGANDPRIVAFHGLFNGVLTLSADPGTRLAELGLGDGRACLGTPAFVGPGPACVARFGDRQLRLKTAQVLLREPGIIFKIPLAVAGQMQVTRPEGLGNYALGESPPLVAQRVGQPWSALKARVFPRGGALFAALVAYTVLGLFGLRGSRLVADSAFVVLIAVVACVLGMLVAFLGDGRQELAKHLFLANVAFDLATIAALNVAIAGGWELRCRRSAAPSVAPRRE